MITVNSTINLTNQAVPPIIPVVQGDTGRSIVFTLADFTIPAGATATYYVQKPSGEAVYNSAEISGNTVTVELTAQSIIEVGENNLQVRVILDEAVVTSFDVILMVRPFRGIGAVESETEMNIFDRALEQAQETVDTMVENAEQAIEDAAEAAEQYISQAIDPTLTIEGKAADAKAVGDALTEINDTLNDPVTGIATKAPAIYCTTSGSLVMLNDGADSMPLKSLTVDVQPVQAGTGDPSPQNVRPITGWTSAKIPVTGKNLVNLAGSMIVPRPWDTTKDAIRIDLPPGTFVGNFNSATIFEYVYGHLYDKSGTVQYTEDNALKFSTNGSSWYARSFTLPDGGRLYLFNASALAWTLSDLTQCDFQIETGSTATEYEAYTGNVYDITFPSSAGTVYGGTVDPVAGTMKVTYEAQTWNGSENWEALSGTNDSFYVPTSHAIANTDIYLCSHYPVLPIGSSLPSDVPSTGALFPRRAYNRLYMMRTGYTSLDTFKAALAASPVQVYMPLATPQTYTLDPVTIRTLLGLNNIWADTGAIEEVTYAADTKMYIDGLTQPDEDMVANQAIESGKYFMVNNRLFLSTASIANGAMIIPGNNCIETNLVEALNSLA